MIVVVRPVRISLQHNAQVSMSVFRCYEIASNLVIIIEDRGLPPQFLAGRAKRLRSRLLGGALPVREVIRLRRIQSSSGLRRSSMLGVILHRNENLCV